MKHYPIQLIQSIYPELRLRFLQGQLWFQKKTSWWLDSQQQKPYSLLCGDSNKHLLQVDIFWNVERDKVTQKVKILSFVSVFWNPQGGLLFQNNSENPFWVFEPPWPTIKPWNSAKKNMRYFNKISLLELLCNHHRNHALYPETKRPDHRDQTLCTSPKQLRKELINGKRNRRGLSAKVSWWHIF